MSKPEYDVAIAGAGPGGASAAYLLAKEGLKVVMVDKAAFPRPKLCAGMITWKTLRLLERVFGIGVDDLESLGILSETTSTYESYKADRLVIKGRSSLPFTVIDREKYDHHLVKLAVEAGAELREQWPVRGYDPDRSTLIASGGQEITARYVLGADGINSRVRRSLVERKLLDADWWNDWVGTCYQVTVPKSDLNRPLDSALLCYGDIDWGYGWVFPAGDNALIGMGALNRRSGANLSKAYRRYLRRYLDEKAERVRPAAHGIPLGHYIDRPARGNCSLLGDATGLIDPVTGEGIFQAQRVAEMIAVAVKKADRGEEPFEQAVNRMVSQGLGAQLWHGHIARWFFMNIFARSTPALKLFYGCFHKYLDDVVHGRRSYVNFIPLGDYYERTPE